MATEGRLREGGEGETGSNDGGIPMTGSDSVVKKGTGLTADHGRRMVPSRQQLFTCRPQNSGSHRTSGALHTYLPRLPQL